VLPELTVLLYPRPEKHTFQSEGADIVCAFVEFGAGTFNPLAAATQLTSCPVGFNPGARPRRHPIVCRSVCSGRWEADDSGPAGRVLFASVTAVSNEIGTDRGRSIDSACGYASCESARSEAFPIKANDYSIKWTIHLLSDEGLPGKNHARMLLNLLHDE